MSANAAQHWELVFVRGSLPLTHPRLEIPTYHIRRGLPCRSPRCCTSPRDLRLVICVNQERREEAPAARDTVLAWDKSYNHPLMSACCFYIALAGCAWPNVRLRAWHWTSPFFRQVELVPTPEVSGRAPGVLYIPHACGWHTSGLCQTPAAEAVWGSA